MQTERRSAPRQGLNSLVYLDLEPGNGGILLNLSEDGMQISVANRLVTSSEIRFTLRLQPRETISGTGQIAWLSPSGRSAGVRFLGLPEEARREIRQWLGVNADTSTAEIAEDHPEPAAEPAQLEAPSPIAPTPANQESLPAPPAEEPQSESSAPSEAQNAPTVESSATPPQSDLSSDLPAEAVTAPEPISEAHSHENSAPEPADALELLEATVETNEKENASPAWSPPAMVPSDFAPAGEEEPSSVLSLYGFDGSEPIESESLPERLEETTGKPLIAAGYPQEGTASRPPFRSWSAADSERSHSRIPDEHTGSSSQARRARARARRRNAARKHPPILLSPIFVPAPPPSESLPPPDPEKLYRPEVAPAGEPFIEQPTAELSSEQSVVAFAATSLPEPSAAESSRAPGALYLPNYRIEQATPAVPAATTRFSWLAFFRKPMPRLDNIFERFEQFGWSLESDWHVWLSLILLLAGFLSLAQKPPLIVLTIAFWFASAVVISDRRRPRHGKHQTQKTGHR